MTDISPLAHALLDAYDRTKGIGHNVGGGACRCSQCIDAAEEIAQAVVGAWKHWIVQQHKREE